MSEKLNGDINRLLNYCILMNESLKDYSDECIYPFEICKKTFVIFKFSKKICNSNLCLAFDLSCNKLCRFNKDETVDYLSQDKIYEDCFAYIKLEIENNIKREISADKLKQDDIYRKKKIKMIYNWCITEQHPEMK